jgi:regulator of protease activity HflC (stomatin/prohibitin superfamily)
MNLLLFAPIPATGPALYILCVAFLAAFLAMIWLASAIRIVPEHQRLAVFRMGRYLGTRGPGAVILIPTLDRGFKVDMREQERSFSSQDILTADQYPIMVETRWHYKITDPMKSVLEVDNFEKTAQEQMISSLREAFGAMKIQDVLAKRQAIAEELCSRFNAAAVQWGVQATKVEFNDIVLPRAAQEAVQRGRTRQAALLGSVGETKSPVYTQGSVELYGEVWNTTSQRPIAPGKKVRVTGVVLEVEEL